MTTVQEMLIFAQARPAPGRGWMSWFAAGFGWRPARRRVYLDPRELSPHLQRDMGFLDGNDVERRR